MAPDQELSGAARAYEVLDELGRGAFGVVLKARQRSTGQLVALKVTPAGALDGAEGDERLRRFRRETRLCAELAHPHIVPLIDSGMLPDGRLFAAFAYVPGVTLAEVLAAEGRLAVPEAAQLCAQVLDALACAHARGIVHRDLKPENIMISRSGVRRHALVLDFGLGGVTAAASAAAASPAELVGTPCYAAPEQLRGAPPSPLADLYAWGLILLECVTGTRAIAGETTSAVLARQLAPDPVPLPPWLRAHPLGRVLEIVLARTPRARDVPVERLLQWLTAASAAPAAAPDDAADPDARERRQLSLVCCRLVPGDTDGVDAEELDQALQARCAALAEAAVALGGVPAAPLGERLLVAFGYPRAAEDDARRAARFALQAAGAAGDGRARLATAVALHAGLVTVPGAGAAQAPRLGALPGIVAAQAGALAARAAPGEVLISDAARLLVRDRFACAPLAAADGAPAAFRLGGALPSGPGAGSWLRDSPLVGRDAQLARLLAGWDAAGSGRGRTVVITGEPGIGKSRLLSELCRRADVQPWLAVECAAEAQATALRPVIDALLALEQPLGTLVAEAALDRAATLPLLAALLGQPLDPDVAALPLSPERQKELTLQALVALVCRRAERQPTLVVVENLHWADPTTLELLTLLVRAQREPTPGAAPPRIFLVCTTRPEGIPPWPGSDATLLPLPRLRSGEVTALLGARGTVVPAPLLARVLDRSEGVPLFVEELARLVGDGDAADTAAAGVAVPATLRELLTARLDRLSPRARETAQLAAVLGREFPRALLEAVAARDAALLARDMEELGRAGLVLARPGRREDGFVFRHALLRDAAYEAMTRAARRGLHRRVADTVRAHFPALERTRPEIVALHCEHGGELPAAVDYWCRAGLEGYRRAAYTEALRTLEHARALVETLDAAPAHRWREVQVLIALGATLLATRGWAVPEVEATFGRAWEICESLGGEPPPMVVYGVWGVRITRSDRAAVEAMLPRLEALAETGGPELVPLVTLCLGTAAYWRGDFVTADRYLTRGRLAYDTERRRHLRPGAPGWNLETGDDGGIYNWAMGFSTQWALGHADRAMALRAEALAATADGRQPMSLALVLGFGAMLAHDCGDDALAQDWGERLIALATEQQMSFWWAPGASAVGRALVNAGHHAEGLALIRGSLERFRTLGVMASYTYYLTWLVEVHLRAGALDEARAAIDEGLRLCGTLVVRFPEPELLRLRAAVAAARGEQAAAEADLRAALTVAERDGARAYMLRAATDLARLLAADARLPEGRAQLATVYGTFTEGFDTADLRRAAALLAELTRA